MLPERSPEACTPDDRHHRDATNVVEEGGQRVCTSCGLVLETHLLQDDWRPFAPVVTTREWAWRRAVRGLFGAIGLVNMDASEFPPPPAGAGKVPYRVLAAYAFWLRFAADVPPSFARAAGQATPAEWRRAARVYGSGSDEDADAEVLTELQHACRRHGLPEDMAHATARALQEPRLEACDPRHVLIACVAESLGDDLAARIFAAPTVAVSRYRKNHHVAEYAVCLEAEGLALRAHVQRCELYAPATETLQRHVRTCPLCCRRAEELQLAFLITTDVDA